MMSLQVPYPRINPTAYLELAQQLAAKSDVASKRTAADRIYLAAFLTSREKLTSKDYLTPYNNENDHKYVSETLRRVLGTAGNDETRLRRARNCVNYDIHDLDDGMEDVRSLEWMAKTADSIIQQVEALPRRSKRS